MDFIIFLFIITLGILSLAQANSESASVVNVQQTPPTGTYFDHLVFIILENAGMSNVCGSGNNPPPCNGPDNPYMSSLANNFTLARQYVDLQGTSQPNYIGIMAATLNGCTSSCGPGTLNEVNLVDRFDAAGLAWKGYMENQTPVAGCDNNDHGFYEIAHNPFLAFHDIDTNSTRCNRIVLANPANNSTCTGTDCALIKDLNSGSAPNFLWVTPNDCNNAHGNSACSNGCISSYTSPCEKAADNYLKGLVPSILNSNTFKNTRSALFITFDEGSGFCPFNGSGEDCMYTVWAGPVAKTNFSSSTLDNHYSFTKTIETNWNLPTITSNDAGAAAMTEFFSTQSPDFTITASPSSLTFPSGNSSSSTITLNSLGSFAGTVTLTKTSSPTGLTLTLNPTSITLTSGGTGTSTLTVSSSQINNYTATVTGTSGALVHNVTLTIHVTPPPNFAISVNPTSLTLSHTLSGAGNPVIVNATGDQTMFESSYLTNSFYAKGLIWIFYEDSRNNCEGHAGCLTYTTSTNGSKWAPPTTVPVHITDSDFSVYTDGSNVFYVRYNESTYENDCGKNIQFRMGALSTSGSVTWQPETTVAHGASNRDYPDDKIIVDSNGQVWIAYMIDNHSACGGSGTDTPQVIHSAGTNYASWTGNTTLTTAQSDNWHIALVSLGNGQVYASFWINSGDLHGRLYNSGWQADEQISSTTTFSDVNAWLFNSGTNVYAIYFDNTTENFDFASRSSTGTWTVNSIGAGEADPGPNTYSNYYSLPDSASYDSANNLFHLYYMNATTRKIDQWVGAGSNWNKTVGIVNTAAVPYADSITSFIQSSPTEIGGIFYISGSGSPFNLNFAALTFASGNLTGTFTATVSSQNGFTGTVSLTTTTTPSTGLTVNCSVTTITGGSGSSLCSLNGTIPGNYNVTVTGVSGSLSHSATVAVTVPSGPDFQISATSPASANVGQSPSSTITITALSGFTGVVTLSDTIPSGLSCGAISPSSITNSGTATVSCSSTVAGNYTLTVKGTSGSLSHSTTALFRFQDFTTSATTPAPVDTTQSATSTITIAALNHFNGIVNLTDTVPSGLTCGPITPTSITGSGTATVSCSASIAGNYTLTLTGSSGSLTHSATATLRFQDFTIAATSPAPANAGQSVTSTVTVAAVNGFSGTVVFSITPSAGLICGSFTPTSVTSSGSATVSCSATIAGNYTATITGSSTPLMHNATATFQFRDFTIGATSPSPVNAGNSATSTITVAAVNHFAGIVTLTDTIPSGLTCGIITPSSVTGSGTATVSCNATIAGNYTLTITGTSGSLVHTSTAIFRFQNFTLSASSPAAVSAGQSAVSTITIGAVNVFAGVVNLTDTVPSGLTCGAITPSTVTGSGTATVSCSATIAGNYTLTVTGTSGSLVHSSNALFQFRDFTIVATTPAAANVGVSSISTLTAAALNHFSGTIPLTDTVPSGLTCGAISPASLTGSGTATISCSAAIAGNYTLTLTGTSGSLVHSTTTLFQFWDFSTTASSPAPVNVGTSTISNITITPTNHFNGTVSLTDTVPLGLVCGAINPSSVTGSGAATVSCNAIVAGNYTLTVTGTSSALVHNTTALFQFRDFTINASAPPPINSGTSTVSSITIFAVNHFAGTVSLTDSVPSGLACGAINPTSVTGSGTATVSCNSAIAGNYTLTVTGTTSSLSHSTTALFRVQDFTISATSPAPVQAGTSVTSTITVSPLNGFTGTVNLTDTVPLNLTCGSISPTTITSSGIATVSCSSTTASTYTLFVTGAIGTLSHTTTATFTITDFSISATSPAPVQAGASANSTITISAVNGFTGSISLTDAIPASLVCGVLTPTTVTNAGTVTVSCSSTVKATYSLTITGTSGTLSHNATATFTVTDFNISATSPNAANVGVPATSNITISAFNGFTGTISLTDTVPSGLTCGAITPATVTGSGNATVACNSSIAGNYTLTLTGASRSLTRTATATFRFQDFTISASPPAAFNVGSNATSTVTVTGLNQFAGTVTLSDSAPSGLTCGAITPINVSGSGSATVSCTATLAGNYTLTIMGSSSSLSHTTNTIFRFVDYAVTATTPAPTLAGASVTSTITITSVNKFVGIVTLNDTIPSNLNCGTINPSSVTGSGTATVSCSSTVAGNYTLTITGTNSSLSHSVAIHISVQDYTVSSSPPGVKINAGSTGSSTISIAALNNFSGTVTLSSSGPIGLTTAVNPATIAGGSGTATLTFSSATAGNYTATLTSSSGSLTHTTTVSVQVVDFTITASPSALTILAGSSGNSTVTIAPLNGFNGSAGLTLTSSMGLTATVTPVSIVAPGTSTLTVGALTAGDYSVTVKATSGSLIHIIIVAVHVLDYSLSGSPAGLVAPIGSSTGSTLTVQSLNGYSGNVSLTFTVQLGSGTTPTGGGLGGRRFLILAPPTTLPNVTISPGSLQLSSGGTQQSTVNVSLPTNLSAGSYLITVTATDGSLSHTTLITILATDFGMTATPNPVSLPRASNTTITLNLQSLNFFQGSVTLTMTSSTGGPTGTLSTSTVQLTMNGNVNLNLTIQAPSSAGNYTITVQAVSGTVSHSLTISVTVTSGFATILAEILSPHNTASITVMGVITILTILGALKLRTYQNQKASLNRRRVEKHTYRKVATSRSVSYSPGVPLLWGPLSMEEF